MIANLIDPELTSQVLIVGAGPAGATAAHYLAKAGFKVTVLDRQTFPRDKVCGDFVGAAALNELQEMGITQLPDFQKTNVINKAGVFMDGKELIEKTMPEFAGLTLKGRVIPRKSLDNWVLNAAKTAGANVLENVLVTGFKVEENAVVVTAKDASGIKTFKASLLIGADGSSSQIATILRGAPLPRSSRIIGIRGYFDGVEGQMDRADLHFASASFPGYCWLFPTSENRANVGVGVLLDTVPKGNQPKDLFFQLTSQDEGLKKRLKNAKFDGKLETWPINTYNQNLPIVGDRVILVGEAAGLVNPLNGEGIQYALQSGRWAAETASMCFHKDDFSAQTLSVYARQVEGELGWGFKISAFIIQLIRNRNLNPIWMHAFETMVSRAKSDPEYANIAGGILAGLILPSEGLTPQFLVSILEEATILYGAKTVSEAISNPTSVPKTAVKMGEAGLEVAVNLMQNPFGFLQWGVETMARMSELALFVPEQRRASITIKAAEQAK